MPGYSIALKSLILFEKCHDSMINIIELLKEENFRFLILFLL